MNGGIKIETSKKIEKNKISVNRYRNGLRPKELTILGLITDGGVGLQTGNNGKFVGCLEGTKAAGNIKVSRGAKLADAFEQHPVLYKTYPKFKDCSDKKEFNEVLEKMSENKIRELFEEIKEDKGRDVFGQGYLYRIISKEEIASISKMTASEKEDGIANNRKDCYVLYDKGDRDGNRWFLESPYYICWNKNTVTWFRNNSGKKEEGSPVLRSPQFYFREGFCWTDVNSVYLKCRIKKKSVHDVLSMSMFPLTDVFPAFYLVCLINSRFMSEFVEEFLNNTSHFQMNDARKVPIICPDAKTLSKFETYFDKAFEIKKKQFAEQITLTKAEEELAKIQKSLDEAVYSLYNINPTIEYTVHQGTEHEVKTVKTDLFTNDIQLNLE